MPRSPAQRLDHIPQPKPGGTAEMPHLRRMSADLSLWLVLLCLCRSYILVYKYVNQLPGEGLVFSVAFVTA